MGLMLQQAPSIRTRSKVRHHEPDVARAIRFAMSLWETPVWLPIVFRGRVVGQMYGDRINRRTLYANTGSFPYSTYSDAANKLTSGNHFSVYWNKPGNTAHVAGNWYDLWNCVGIPQAGGFNGTAKVSQLYSASTAGAMQIGAAVSPTLKYLTRASQFSSESTIHAMLLYDRVLAYDACTMTASSQNMTNSSSATRHLSFPGLQIFVEGQTVHNATAASLTVCTYTSGDGVTGELVPTSPTLTKIPSVAAPTTTLGARGVIQAPGISTKNQLYLPLTGSDLGVSLIQNYTWSAAPTGTVSFVLQFPYAMFVDTVFLAQVSDVEMIYGFDAICKQIYDDSCLSWMVYTQVTAQPTHFHGVLEFGW
jgi:hypothetical protein